MIFDFNPSISHDPIVLRERTEKYLSQHFWIWTCDRCKHVSKTLPYHYMVTCVYCCAYTIFTVNKENE